MRSSRGAVCGPGGPLMICSMLRLTAPPCLSVHTVGSASLLMGLHAAARLDAQHVLAAIGFKATAFWRLLRAPRFERQLSGVWQTDAMLTFE